MILIRIFSENSIEEILITENSEAISGLKTGIWGLWREFAATFVGFAVLRAGRARVAGILPLTGCSTSTPPSKSHSLAPELKTLWSCRCLRSGKSRWLTATSLAVDLDCLLPQPLPHSGVDNSLSLTRAFDPSRVFGMVPIPWRSTSTSPSKSHLLALKLIALWVGEKL